MRWDWNEFWFAPRSSVPLGLLRLAYGALVVLCGGMLFSERILWFSERGVLKTVAADAYNVANAVGPRLNLLHGVRDDFTLILFFVVFLASAVCLMVGLWTRAASILVWVGLLSLHNRDGVMLNGGDVLMRVIAFYLIFAPAGAACSVDRLLRVLRGEEGDTPPLVASWSLRLIQFQVAIVYLDTFLLKMSGSHWRDGTAAYYPFQLTETARFPVPFMDAHHLWLINAATYGTLATEFALAILIWFPRLRLYVIAAGVALHLGIEYSMNIPLFSFLMIACYISFLREADLQHFVAWMQEPLAVTRLRLVYDGECDFCRSALLVVRFLDVFRLVTFLDCHRPDEMAAASGVPLADAEQAAIAIDRRNRRYPGFFAFRALAWRLPVCWPIAWLLYVPGIPWLGVRAYRWIAANRSRLPVAPVFGG